jgi:hypothetical protein
MDNLTLIATLIGQLALISRDPALGYRGQALTETLALLGALVARGEEARAELEALAAQIQAMVAADREPTKAEWTGLRDLSKGYNEVFNPVVGDEPETTGDGN